MNKDAIAKKYIRYMYIKTRALTSNRVDRKLAIEALKIMRLLKKHPELLKEFRKKSETL